MLIINDLSLRIAGRLLLDHASVTLPTGSKAGLVGRNGTGKTTLFNAITGEISAETGSIGLPKNVRIGQVAQEAPGTEEPLIEIVLKADTERLALMTEEQTATDPHRIAEIHMRLADIDAHSAEARAATILAGLGFDTDAQQRPASSFSGGWRMRVALASVLFAAARPAAARRADQLSRPRRHAVAGELRRALPAHRAADQPRPRPARTAPSPRSSTSTRRSSPSGAAATTSSSGSAPSRPSTQEKSRRKQEAARKHMEAFVERFRAKASKARQAQSRIKALERMKPIAAMVNDTVRPFSFPEPVKTVASPIIAINGGTVGYTAGNPVLKQLTLRIDADDRIALLGANGNGKSTFAKLLAGRLKLETGSMTVAPQLKVAIFAQHQLDDLQARGKRLRACAPADAGGAGGKGPLARRAVRAGDREDGHAAKDLSGGEKARLLMGLASFEGPNLFILDEPTNHLDIDSRESLIHALNDFPGAVILISHDRHLIEATADRLWLVKDGTVKPYDGDLSDYRQEVVGDSGDRRQRREADKASKADRRREAAQRRAALEPVAKQIRATEALIDRIRKRIDTIEDELANPALYEKDPTTATQLARERSELGHTLAGHEERWLTLSQEYEEGIAE